MTPVPNTFNIDVKAEQLLEYASEAELTELIEAGRITIPWLHIGGGSNLLFTKDFMGTVLHSRIMGIEVVAEDEATVEVRVGAGMVWDDFVAYCVEHGWYGAENLSLIPGEVGAAAVQNIGAYGVEVKDLITSVETINLRGEQRIYMTKECKYHYRTSLLKRPEMNSVFVTRVNFLLSRQRHFTTSYGSIRQELERHPRMDLPTMRQVIIDIRRSKLPDPKEIGNAGSFFMNPLVSRKKYVTLQQAYPEMPHYDMGPDQVKIPAGWLIEQCGWKGKALGRAAVYDRQALVLVNLGGATGMEILALASAVRESVAEKFGIEIYPEVKIL